VYWKTGPHIEVAGNCGPPRKLRAIFWISLAALRLEYAEHRVEMHQLSAKLFDSLLGFGDLEQDFGTLRDQGIHRHGMSFVAAGHARFPMPEANPPLAFRVRERGTDDPFARTATPALMRQRRPAPCQSLVGCTGGDIPKHVQKALAPPA
jgi:hypothetical protein